MLLVTVLALSARMLMAEYRYMRGFQEDRDINAAVGQLEQAAEFYPFDHKFRDGPRRLMKQALEQAVQRASRP
jgi:hypothetical protein